MGAINGRDLAFFVVCVPPLVFTDQEKLSIALQLTNSLSQQTGISRIFISD
jgi:hypothetical protein